MATDVTIFKPRRGTRLKEVFFSFPGHPLDGKLTETSTTSFVDNTANSDRRRRNSSLTPNYRDILRRRVSLLPENSFSLQIDKDSGSYHQGSFQRISFPAYSKEVFTTSGAAFDVLVGSDSYLGIDSSVLANARNTLANNLLLKIKNQKVNVGQAFAERAQTSRLVSESATRIAAALVALKKGNLPLAARELGLKQTRRMKNRRYVSSGEASQSFMSKSWLELQYGWKPLLSDIYGSMETLAKIPFRDYLCHVAASNTLSDKDQKVTLTNGDPQIRTRTIDRNVTTTLKYGMWFSVGDVGMKSLSELGITNPALIAWELVPWSFVVDWFLPIGNFISSWDATSGCVFQQGYLTEVSKRRQWVIDSYALKSSASTGFVGIAARNFENVSLVRTKLVNFPSPRPPSFKNPLSVEHVANAMALLVQLRK